MVQKRRHLLIASFVGCAVIAATCAMDKHRYDPRFAGRWALVRGGLPNEVEARQKTMLEIRPDGRCKRVILQNGHLWREEEYHWSTTTDSFVMGSDSGLIDALMRERSHALGRSRSRGFPRFAIRYSILDISDNGITLIDEEERACQLRSIDLAEWEMARKR